LCDCLLRGSSVTDIANKMGHQWSFFAPEEEYVEEEEPSPRKGTNTYAAPCSSEFMMRQSFDAQQGYDQDRQMTELMGSKYNSGSFYAQNGSVTGPSQQMAPCASFLAMPSVGFKDGSSQLMTRPTLGAQNSALDIHLGGFAMSKSVSHYNPAQASCFNPPSQQSGGSQMLPSSNASFPASTSFATMTVPFKDGSSQLMLRRSGYHPDFVDPQVNLVGGSFLKSSVYRQRENNFFISDPEDIVDVQIAEYFTARPEMYLKTLLTRIRPGVYSMFEGAGREILVEWVGPSKKQGQLVVSDGPVRQPFADFMENKSPNPSDFSIRSAHSKNTSQNLPRVQEDLPQLPDFLKAQYNGIIDRKRDKNRASAQLRSVAMGQGHANGVGSFGHGSNGVASFGSPRAYYRN